MKKVIVIGCPGSGKTTFSERLRDRTGLPLIYLDAIWHLPDRTHVTREAFDARLTEIGEMDAWIIDGNYSRTLERRMQMCDTVILFDLPVEVCLRGVMERLGRKRPDMPWIDTEPDPWLLSEIESFPEKNLPAIYDLLERYREGRQVVIFRSREEADEYLLRLAATAPL